MKLLKNAVPLALLFVLVLIFTGCQGSRSVSEARIKNDLLTDCFVYNFDAKYLDDSKYEVTEFKITDRQTEKSSDMIECEAVIKSQYMQIDVSMRMLYEKDTLGRWELIDVHNFSSKIDPISFPNKQSVIDSVIKVGESGEKTLMLMNSTPDYGNEADISNGEITWTSQLSEENGKQAYLEFTYESDVIQFYGWYELSFDDEWKIVKSAIWPLKTDYAVAEGVYRCNDGSYLKMNCLSENAAYFETFFCETLFVNLKAKFDPLSARITSYDPRVLQKGFYIEYDLDKDQWICYSENCEYIFEKTKEKIPSAAKTLSINDPSDITFRDAGENVILSKSHIKYTEVGFEDDAYYLKIISTQEGAGILSEYTQNNIGKTLGIYVDDTCLVKPTISAEITDGTMWLSGLDKYQAYDLAFKMQTSIM